MNCHEALERITALVDEELSDLERQAVEGHMKGCLRCRYALQRERELKHQVHAAGAKIVAPADLRRRILADAGALPEEREVPAPGRLRSPLGSMLRPIFALALLALLVLPLSYWMRSRATPPLSEASLEIHQKIQKGSLSFVRVEGRSEAMALLSRSVEGRFAPMGYDLSRVGLKVVGGLVRELEGRKILVSVYRGSSPEVSCFTLLGSEKDIPPGARLVPDPNGKQPLYAFSKGKINGVLHREGELICILVSEMPMEELLALAGLLRQSSRA